MVILIKDSTNVVFENNFYDTILFDPPYMTEAEFNKKFVGEGKKGIIQTQRDLFVYSPVIEKIEERINKYAQKDHRAWVIVFSNYRTNSWARYHVNWMKKRGGMGGKIRRNTEYIHFLNNAHPSSDVYVSSSPAGTIDETIFIPRDRNGRACAKPVKLYETIYKFLDSKKILDLFAGWGDSVIAAQNLGLHIDAYDIDQSLAERYNYLNSLSNKKQLTLREVSS